MAANIIEPGSSLAELASNLDLLQVPDKLHCSTCQSFLVNAYRTTCCESYVCDKCFDQLNDNCPICKHKPFSQELVRPNKAMRATAKAYLKTIEKTQAEEKARLQVSETPTLVEHVSKQNNLVVETGHNSVVDSNGDSKEQIDPYDSAYSPEADIKQSIEVGSPTPAVQANGLTPVQETDQTFPQDDFQSDDGEEEYEDEIEIQVEPAQEDDFSDHQIVKDGYEDETSFNGTATKDHPATPEKGTGASNTMDESFNEQPNMGMGYNMNMQPMQMMQQMQQMMMNNPMMGAMGMNSNMFGGYQNGSMNGMDMSMMGFNPNQNMFGWNGQHNNFSNPYSNGIAGNFGQQFGFDMSQQGNFQQQFQNGDFQNGYSDFRGRGRGRYRGGRGSFRGRGQFNQYSQASFHGQSPYERQQQETYPAQGPVQDRRNGQRGTQDNTDIKEEEVEPGNDNFAPGGQDEVQEALGNDYGGSKDQVQSQDRVKENASVEPAEPDNKSTDTVPNGADEEVTVKPSSPVDKGIPEAYHEDFDVMAPPTAPSGPSSRYNDLGFRSRGRGRYAQGRGSFSLREHHPASPIRSASHASLAVQSPPGKGLGVQGAPTGPKAMRNSTTTKSSPQINGGGFQIKGQAAAQVTPQPINKDRSRSPSLNGYDSQGDRSLKRKYEYDHPRTSRHDNEPDSSHDRSDRDRKRKRSRRDDHEDLDGKDADDAGSRTHSPARKAHRSSRYDRDRDWDREQERERDRERDKASSKHRSSRRYHDEDGDDSHEVDDYGELVDTKSSKYRASHRSNKASKYDDRERAGHKHREKDREDRHRKRSRHERDREEDYVDADEEESRHRSRRHKKEHHASSKRDRERDRDRDQDLADDIGLRISGHSSSNRHAAVSALPTPTSAAGEPSQSEKDPHTLEREARNKERMVKEQQRREKAAAEKQTGGPNKHSRGTVSGGRRVSYKYEDEIERGMDEREQRRR